MCVYSYTSIDQSSLSDRCSPQSRAHLQRAGADVRAANRTLEALALALIDRPAHRPI